MHITPQEGSRISGPNPDHLYRLRKEHAMGKNEEIESALKRYEKGERPQQNDSYYLNELAKEGSSRGNAWRDYKAGKRKTPR